MVVNRPNHTVTTSPMSLKTKKLRAKLFNSRTKQTAFSHFTSGIFTSEMSCAGCDRQKDTESYRHPASLTENGCSWALISGSNESRGTNARNQRPERGGFVNLMMEMTNTFQQ